MPGHAWPPRLDGVQEVSTKPRKSAARSTSCSAVSVSMMIMGPPQTGQDHEGGGCGEAGQERTAPGWPGGVAGKEARVGLVAGWRGSRKNGCEQSPWAARVRETAAGIR